MLHLFSQSALAVGGMRPDVLRAIIDLKPASIRYPGGCFASASRWKDGIGPRDQRRYFPDVIWADRDPSQFGTDEFGGKDVGDVVRLLDLSLTLPSADASNIFMLGASRGGMMSYLVARQRTDIRAMATIAGATDLLAGLEWRPEMERVYRDLIPRYDSNKQAALESRSALHWVDQIPTDLPVLLLHGEADERVNVSDSRAMATRLKQLGRPHKLVVYPGDNHVLQLNRRPAHQEVLSWFGLYERH